MKTNVIFTLLTATIYIWGNNIDNAVFCFHGNALRIYYIFDSDISRQLYKRKEILRFNGNNCYAKLHNGTSYGQWPSCYSHIRS